LVLTNANLASCVYLQAFSKQVSRLQVGQLKSYGVSLVLFMSRRLRYLLCMCSSWLKLCSATYVMANASRA